jgi:CBS domain-containing protein
MKVKDILREKGPDVITIWEEKNVSDAVATMVRNKIGALMVLNDKSKITGIISERDVLRIVSEKADKLAEIKVKEAMVKKVIIGDQEDTLEYIESIMTENKIRHIPVISEKRLVGIISIGDIVKTLSSKIKSENRYLKNYIEGKPGG